MSELLSGFFNPFPKYLQVRDILLRRLQHEYAPGDRFPTEHRLCEEFGVSRDTVREALRLLAQEDLIERCRGRGTVVVRRPAKPERRLTGLVEDFTELRQNTFTRLIRKAVVPVVRQAAVPLDLAEGEPVYLIQRIRILGSLPLAQHNAYLPVEIGVPLGRLDLTRTTISRELRTAFGLDLWEDYQEFDAAVADSELSRLLEVAAGSPLLEIRRRYLSTKSPVVFFQSYFRSDRYFATIRMPEQARPKPAVKRRTRLAPQSDMQKGAAG